MINFTENLKLKYIDALKKEISYDGNNYFLHHLYHEMLAHPASIRILIHSRISKIQIDNKKLK